jgi:8-oxo-dGTP pyrophosphatase MutT (NUDIX family)
LRPPASAAGDETEPEVLFIQRPATMAFGPGLHVFPGGKVDPEDADGEPCDAVDDFGGNVSTTEAAALRRAAIREVVEEIGVRLDQSAVLAPIAHFTTPIFMPRRFSTWFFVADLPSGAEPVFAPDEVAGHAWLTPSAAFQRLAAGEIEMWVPTTSTLERLLETGARTAADVARRVQLRPAAASVVTEETELVVRLAFGAAGGLPGRRCETTVLGRREVVVVDPGDASEEAIRLIEETVARRGGTIRAVVLTAPDPDHAAGAEMLAIPHGVPVLVAPGAGRRLPYRVVELREGDGLPADVPIRLRFGLPGSGRLELDLDPASSAGE